MPAQIIVQSDESEVAYWVELPVIRIGSGPECDIVLTDTQIASHAVTVEYRNGQYFIHNRSAQTIDVDGRQLDVGASSLLSNGRSVRLDQDLQFLLAIEGDPAPSEPPLDRRFQLDMESSGIDGGSVETDEVRDEQQFDEDAFAHVNENDTGSSSFDAASLLRTGVIIFCFVAIAFILMAKLGMKDAATVRSDKKLVYFVEAARAAMSDWQIAVAKELQRAERDRLRGQTDVAARRLYQIRDAVQSPPLSSDKQFASQANQFILDQISIAVGD